MKKTLQSMGLLLVLFLSAADVYAEKPTKDVGGGIAAGFLYRSWYDHGEAGMAYATGYVRGAVDMWFMSNMDKYQKQSDMSSHTIECVQVRTTKAWTEFLIVVSSRDDARPASLILYRALDRCMENAVNNPGYSQ